MGLSSLLFGGLTLLHGRNGSGTVDETDAKASTIREALIHGLGPIMADLHDQLAGVISLFLPADFQTLITGLLVISIIFTIAYSTKPSDASFRSYLTDLSLHQHLRHIHEQSRRLSSSAARGDVSQPIVSSSQSGEVIASDAPATEPTRADDWSPDQSYPHVLTFANRISISFRTPPYVRHDYVLFSIVMVAHPAIPCPNLFSSTTKPGQRKGHITKSTTCIRCAAPDSSIHSSRTSWYIGAFGRWWTGARDVLDKSVPHERKGHQHTQTPESHWGVLEMRSGDDKKKRGRPSPGVERPLARDSPTEETNPTALSSNPKPLRRKKHPHRLRASLTPAQASARSTAIAQQQQRKALVDEPARNKVERTIQDEEEPATKFGLRDPSSLTSVPPESASASSPTLAFEPTSAATEAAVDDLRLQLSSLKASSESTRHQLQCQLDELRVRKRDEDTARSDLRGRMKTLDEGKRTAEAAKRDAERRLRTAQAVKETLEKKIFSAETALKTLAGRQADAVRRVQDELQNGHSRRAGIESDRVARLQSIDDAEETLKQYRMKNESLAQRVVEEQRNVKCAEQSLRERSNVRAQQAAAAASAAATLLPNRPIYGSSDTLHSMSNGYQSGEAFPFGPPRSLSALMPPVTDDGQSAAIDEYYRSSPTHPHFPHQHASRRSSQDPGRSSVGVGNAPVLHNTDVPFQSFTGPPPHSGHLQSLEPSSHGLPFSRASPSIGGPAGADQTLHHPRSYQNLSGAFTPTESNGALPTCMVPPVSPFSTDLLPSNLFANPDEDESHPGALPGSRSAAIEATLGRFGLDMPDQSDIDGNQPDRDTADGVLERALGPLSEHESEEDAPTNAKSTSARTWWGSNKGRQVGKERLPRFSEISDADAAPGGLDSEIEIADPGLKQQRKAFGSFPRLSLNQLNPGAKVFRSAARKQADADALRGLNRNGFGSDGYLGSTAIVRQSFDWSTPSVGDHSSASSHPGHPNSNSGVSYDAVRRAFEASNPPDDEEGRRSWSAFDQWSQRQGFQPHASRMNGGGRVGGVASQTAAPARSISTGTRRTATISPATSTRNLGDGFEDVWPEDLFQPLDRTSSARSPDASISSSMPSSLQESSPLAQRERPTNRSRFAFWSQNSKGSLHSAGSNASEPPLSSSIGGGSGNSLLQTSSTASGASSGSPSQTTEGDKSENSTASSSKAKRSFRWPRRSQTATSTASAASDADADEE